MADITLDMFEYSSDATTQSTYPCPTTMHPFTIAPVHYYPMSDPVGASIKDYGSAGNDLSFYSTTNIQTNALSGKLAGRVHYWGGVAYSSYATGSCSSAICGGATWSACYWVYKTNNTVKRGIANIGRVAFSNALGFGSGNTGYCSYYLGGVTDTEYGTTAIANNTWTWVYLEWDYPTTTLYCYINNASSDGSINTGGYTANGTIMIGTDVDNASNYFHLGRIEDLAFFSRKLTASERAWIYNSGTGRHIPCVVTPLIPTSEASIKSQGSYSMKCTGNITMPAATGGLIVPSSTNTMHIFTSSGTFTPVNSGNIQIECWGGGGGGGVIAGNGGGGGGGGGYSKTNSFSTTGGVGYTITVGAGGGDEGAGGATSFNTSTTYANGGGAASDATGGTGAGTGGSAAGDVKYGGGNGGNGFNTYDCGGGGGGAGGPDGTGTAGSTSSTQVGGAGGSGDAGSGGAGGTGGNPSFKGNQGKDNIKGGGGGGGGADGFAGSNGGNPGGGAGGGEVTGSFLGGTGCIIITYVTNTQMSSKVTRTI